MAQALVRRAVSNAMLLGTAAYVVAVAAAMLWLGVAPTPDFLVVALAPALFLTHRLSAWVRDWAPFVAVLLLWDGLRALADRLSVSGIHAPGLAIDRAVFGDPIPPVALQQVAAAAHVSATVDVVATIVDLGHFPGVFVLALVIWFKGRAVFGRYAQALFATAFIALVVFLVWPTSAPWYAAEQGDLAGLHHVMNDVMTVRWSGYYNSLDPNRFAAFPSLHAALPLLGYLALRRLGSRLAWAALAWTLLMWVSIVYLGEHYVADVAAGAALAATCWVAVGARPWSSEGRAAFARLLRPRARSAFET